jgi:hypothetical protein
MFQPPTQAHNLKHLRSSKLLLLLLLLTFQPPCLNLPSTVQHKPKPHTKATTSGQMGHASRHAFDSTC